MKRFLSKIRTLDIDQRVAILAGLLGAVALFIVVYTGDL